MNLNANALILLQMNELLNIPLLANNNYNSQAETVGKAFGDAFANKTRSQHMKYNPQFKLYAKAFWKCVCTTDEKGCHGILLFTDFMYVHRI